MKKKAFCNIAKKLPGISESIGKEILFRQKLRKENGARSGPVKMNRRAPQKAISGGVSAIEFWGEGAGTDVQNQSSLKRSKEEIRDHSAPGDWQCGICLSTLPKSTFRCQFFGDPTNWSLRPGDRYYGTSKKGLLVRCPGIQERCIHVVPGDPDSKNENRAKYRRKRGKANALSFMLYVDTTTEEREALRARHAITNAYEEGGPSLTELEKMAEKYDAETTRYAKTRRFFSSKSMASLYPKNENEDEAKWPCPSCHLVVRQSVYDSEAALVTVDMLNHPELDKCKMCFEPRPSTPQYRWICRSRDCERKLTDDRDRLCTHHDDRLCSVCGADRPSRLSPDWIVSLPADMTEDEYRKKQLKDQLGMYRDEEWWSYQPYLPICLARVGLSPTIENSAPWSNDTRLTKVWEDQSPELREALQDLQAHLEWAYWMWALLKEQEVKWHTTTRTKVWLQSQVVLSEAKSCEFILTKLKAQGVSEEDEIYKKVDIVCRKLDIYCSEDAQEPYGSPYGVNYSPGSWRTVRWQPSKISNQAGRLSLEKLQPAIRKRLWLGERR